MELASKFLLVLASSSLWLIGSGLVLWLCLRSRLRLSPGTRAAASLLVVLQGWIWIGIPVELDLAWLQPKPAANPSEKAAADRTALAVTAQPMDAPATAELPSQAGSGLVSAAGQVAGSTPLLKSGLVASSGLVSAAKSSAAKISASKWLPDVIRTVIAATWAIWMTGIAVLLWRSIHGFFALSRIVHGLPRAPVEWQRELAALCFNQGIRGKQAMGGPLALKVGDVASPMLVQTWRNACIVVPAWLWETCTAEQRNSILLHELAHYRRGDVWRQLAIRLMVIPHWFNPVAWWAAGQFEAASEVACDEAACGDDPRQAISYSKALLVLNETILHGRLGIHYSQALAISGGSLTERIRRVLHPEFQKESQMSRFLILSAMTVLAGLATIRIQAADESSAAKNEAANNEQDTAPTLRRRTIVEEFDNAEPAKATAVSLLVNGGFEEFRDDSSDPDSWFATRYPPTVGHFLMSASKSVVHSGKRSVFVEIADSHPDTRVDYNWTAEAKGWKAGETYELSGWIKTENAKGPGFIMAQCWSEDGKRALGYSEKPCNVTGTADWTRVSTLLRVPEGTASVRIRAGLSSLNNRGAKAWLDDLSLVKVARSANESKKNESAKNEAATAPGGSLLANGGFEAVQENSNDPQAWFGTRIQKTAGHFVLASSSVAHSGKRSVVVEIGDSHPDPKVAYNWTAVADGWKAGETYELSGWIKTENVNKTAFIMAQFWSEEGMVGGATTQFVSPVKGTTDWTRVRTRLKVPEGTRSLRIRAGLSSEDNRGAKAWLDDISLVKVASN